MIFLTFALVCLIVTFTRQLIAKFDANKYFVKGYGPVSMPPPTAPPPLAAKDNMDDMLVVNDGKCRLRVIHEGLRFCAEVDLTLAVFCAVGEEEHVCVICLDEFRPSEMLCRLPCGHDFHPMCTLSWKAKENKCPLCRAPLELSSAPLSVVVV